MKNAENMTHSEKIIAFLNEHKGQKFDDDELSRILKIRPRQQVYQRCREMAEDGIIKRGKVNGKLHNWVE